MAREKPVIATEIAGNRERVKNQDSGLLVRPRDCEVLRHPLRLTTRYDVLLLIVVMVEVVLVIVELVVVEELVDVALVVVELVVEEDVELEVWGCALYISKSSTHIR
jgi:hypothetical protein